jgi:hypothetical protein
MSVTLRKFRRATTATDSPADGSNDTTIVQTFRIKAVPRNTTLFETAVLICETGGKSAAAAIQCGASVRTVAVA